MLEAALPNLSSSDPVLRARWERLFQEIHSFEAEDLFLWLLSELEDDPGRMN